MNKFKLTSRLFISGPWSWLLPVLPPPSPPLLVLVLQITNVINVRLMKIQIYILHFNASCMCVLCVPNKKEKKIWKKRRYRCVASADEFTPRRHPMLIQISVPSISIYIQMKCKYFNAINTKKNKRRNVINVCTPCCINSVFGELMLTKRPNEHVKVTRVGVGGGWIHGWVVSLKSLVLLNW